MTTQQTKKMLTPEQYNICFLKGTEPPGSGALLHEHRSGSYHCVNCGNLLFRSDTKYESGTGWPSFWDVTDPKNVTTENDDTLGMHRTEVLCANCGAHLGHVFNDGPIETTGKRYCINSLALTFKTSGMDTFADTKHGKHS